MAKDPFPLDRGWAWVIVLGGFVGVFFMIGVTKSLGMLLIEFQTYFDIPTSLAAMVMGVAAVVYALAAPACIMLGQSLGVRRVALAGALVGFVGMSLSSLVFSIEYVIVTFGLCLGIANASMYGNFLVALGTYFEKKRTLASGVALAGASMGQFALPPFIEYLLETYGLSGCLLLISGVFLHTAAAACLFRPLSFWAPLEKPDHILPEEEERIEGTGDDTLIGATAVGTTAHAEGVQSVNHGNDALNSCDSVINGDLMNNYATVKLGDGVNSRDTVKHNDVVEHGDIVNSDDGVNGNIVTDDNDTETPLSVQNDTEHNSSLYGAYGASRPLIASVKETTFRPPPASEPTRSTLTYKPYMTSTGSVCLYPPSMYGSSLLCEILDSDLQDEKGTDTGGKDAGFCTKLKSMMDLSVLRSYMAIFVTLFSFIGFFGYFNFVLFLPATVLTRGIDKYDKAILVSVCGVGDLVGRLTTAAIGDRNFLARYKIMALATILISVNIGGMVWADVFQWMLVHCVLYGLFSGVYVGVAVVVLIDFVGLANMPRVLALVVLLQGVGAAAGQPMLGALKDATGSFQSVLVVCAVCNLLCGLLLFCYPLVLSLEHRLPPHRRLLPEETKTPKPK